MWARPVIAERGPRPDVGPARRSFNKKFLIRHLFVAFMLGPAQARTTPFNPVRPRGPGQARSAEVVQPLPLPLRPGRPALMPVGEQPGGLQAAPASRQQLTRQ